MLAVVTWAILLAALSMQLGFSAEVGAFLAGIALASTRYRDAVASRLGTLRDSVLVFFFVQLGTRVDPGTVTEQWVPIAALSLFVLIGNPIIVMTIMGSLGYRRRVAFKTGLYIARISEFSLILVALGVAQGHIGPDLLGVVTVIGVVTIALSTELIHNADRLYRRFERPLTLFVAVAIAARVVLPPVVHVLARQAELLVLAAVTWAVALAAVAHLLGFSEEVGAFLAGVALASSDYREAISGRLSTLRDFLLVFFFIDLGTQLAFEGLDDLGLIGALTLFVLIGKPVLIAVIGTLLGFQARVATTAGLTLGQISEFSLILAALGVALGQIEGRVAGVMSAVALLTITVSTLLSAQADRLVPTLSRPLLRFQRSRTRREVEQHGRFQPEVVVIGLGRLGQTVFDELADRGVDVLGVDHDPRTSKLTDPDAPVVFGDLSDPELPSHLPLSKVRWIVATPRNAELHRDLLTALRRAGYQGRLAVAVDHADEERLLRRLGVHLVIRPLEQAADPLIRTIQAHARDHHATSRTLE